MTRIKKTNFYNHGGWMKDLINFHQCGYCSHRKNLKIVARELHKLMNNKKWIKENGKNTYRLFKHFFNHDKNAKHIEKILISVVMKDNLAEKIAPGKYLEKLI